MAAPAGFDETLGPLPEDVVVSRAAGGNPPQDTGPFDVVVYFPAGRAEPAEAIRTVRPLTAPACGLWIAWPKRASGRPTDLTGDVVREVALPTGLVDDKICAIDAAWSALRLVIRCELR